MSYALQEYNGRPYITSLSTEIPKQGLPSIFDSRDNRDSQCPRVPSSRIIRAQTRYNCVRLLGEIRVDPLHLETGLIPDVTRVRQL
ncbi:hypothetical protein DICSQDRAFT_140723 [Dichomitus squalens LYAD-421 SS1]|uniref:Uncharacterized protein n=1 Tax=Dichomitus squalens (strain LYAD-421) TaxID=732165 RepID=R7SQ06_DICSQ|nr:uncharacterized protein DICSQDRAFT_140723 [Dichomitus squalens LYAD-421 SS1]EJF57062.1 hypothetical protein DICSQDRAFT_140723 [Dichomitus squalens LYAD-421 SS1]